MNEAAIRFTTRELSMRTIDGFEQFFSQVHGCACTTTGHMGTMSMFEKAGFTPTQRDEHRSAADPYHRGDFVVMRRHV